MSINSVVLTDRIRLTDLARPISPSSGELAEKSTDSIEATPNVWPGRANPAIETSSVTIFPETDPDPYVILNGFPVSLKELLLCAPRKTWLP